MMQTNWISWAKNRKKLNSKEITATREGGETLFGLRLAAIAIQIGRRRYPVG
jgi:hypothetical protein